MFVGFPLAGSGLKSVVSDNHSILLAVVSLVEGDISIHMLSLSIGIMYLTVAFTREGTVCSFYEVNEA